ncbi:MAG: hypothetical protein IJV76_11625, partial [Clostridia bacterium]|nr:hypothetical protein [Clostridia bacterium]
MKTKKHPCRTILSLLSALLLLNGCGNESPSADTSAVPAAVSNVPETDESPSETPLPSVEEPEEKTEKEEEKLELLLYYDTYNKEYVDLLVENFREYYPEVTVLLRDYTDMTYREAKTQLGEDLHNGKAPDLILDDVPSGYSCIPDPLSLLDDGKCLPLGELT